MSPKKTKGNFKLPKNALEKANMGQAFAEYDRVLKQSNTVFVRTPAIEAALNSARSKCFFVGRRGTGKTAITFFLDKSSSRTILLQPQTFSAKGLPVDEDALRDVSQKHFRSLVACFKRALLTLVLENWVKHDTVSYDDSRSFSMEKSNILDMDFDLRMLSYVDCIFQDLQKPQDRDWLREIKRVETLAREMEDLNQKKTRETLVLIDRVDEAWDGSDTAVLFLMALMHACIELSSHCTFIRPLLFLRENIFERVKQIDNEYSRLETCVVSLDWTEALLEELIERRLQNNLTTKPAIGDTWDYFFEQYDGRSSRELVFRFCQLRPRDVITYCSLAIESAIGARREKVAIEDLQEARKRFSESRLKDLGDEYSENYPQLQLILHRFHGLGTEFTVSGVDSLVKKLLVDDDVRQMCGGWIFDYTSPPRFIALMYSIGFWGIRTRSKEIRYRSVGAKAAATPAIDQSTHVVVHPSYHHGLDLPDRIIKDLDNDLDLQQEGLILDIPDAIRLNEYVGKVQGLLDAIDGIPTGREGESEFEDWVGELIELCFYRSLTNFEPQVRDIDGKVRRDWIASNRANDGFWEMVRSRHGATQIIFECKNFEDLPAAAFHQMGYYANDTIGRFAIVCFRGESIERRYVDHLKRLLDKENKLILLFSIRDLKVFLRQAKNGKIKESHIQEIYDRTVRQIS